MSSEGQPLTYSQALDEALRREMRDDSSVFCMGTAPPRSLLEEFGPERVRTAPISEPAMTGMAIGAAADGKRPVVLWRNITFAFNSFDQVANQAAKLRYMSGGQTELPIVFRAPCGASDSMAAQHSQSPYAVYAQVPGLKVVLPADPGAAIGLLRASIRDPNPVMCFEPARCNALEAEVTEFGPAPLGKAVTKRAGRDVTLVALGAAVQLALSAAEQLAPDISVEVLDPRTVAPLDIESVRESVRRTGRLVVADEAPTFCSLAAEISAAIVEDAHTFGCLTAPARRVGAWPVPMPFSRTLEDAVLPDVKRIVEAVRAVTQRSAR